MEYKHSYLLGNVRALNFMVTLIDLCNTLFYINEDFVINDEWEAIFNRNIEHDAFVLWIEELLECYFDDEDINPIYETIIHGYK